MTSADWISYANVVAVPVGVLAMAGVAYAAVPLAAYIREKTHNERLARLAEVLGRYAGDIAGKLQSLPPGSNLDAAKALLIQTAKDTAKVQMADTIKSLGGASDTVLKNMISGELGKITAPAAAVALAATKPLLMLSTGDTQAQGAALGLSAAAATKAADAG